MKVSQLINLLNRYPGYLNVCIDQDDDLQNIEDVQEFGIGNIYYIGIVPDTHSPLRVAELSNKIDVILFSLKREIEELYLDDKITKELRDFISGKMRKVLDIMEENE